MARRASEEQADRLVTLTQRVLFSHAVGLTALLGALVAGLACDGSSTNPSSLVPIGGWGGDHVAMTVGDTTHLEFDCANGDIPGPLRAEARGQFAVAGTFVREHGGPIRPGEVPDSYPAIYAGSVTLTSMVLTVRLTQTNETIGTFTLIRGAAGRVVKCL